MMATQKHLKPENQVVVRLLLSEIKKLLKPLESEWHELGVHLKLKKSTLNTIEANYRTSGVQRCLTEVISYWLENESEPSWKKLADAVRNVGGQHVVEKMVRARCSQRKETESGYGTLVPSSDSEYGMFDKYSLSPGCGCGTCDVHKMCMEGCPQPDYTKRLPILTKYTGGETASEVVIKRLSSPGHPWSIEDFEEETSDICEHFGSVVTDICRSFKKREDKSEVALYLLNSFPILKDKADEINHAENMTKLFTTVTIQACSWFNFKIIKRLIKKFGCINDCERLAEYEQHFERFTKHRLPQGMTHVELGSKAGITGCKQLVIKVDREWESITIGELERLSGEFARILQVDRKNLYLADVSEGCVMLTFMVPQEIAVTFSKSRLTRAQKDMLTQESVVGITCSKFRWRSTMLSSRQQSLSDSDEEEFLDNTIDLANPKPLSIELPIPSKQVATLNKSLVPISSRNYRYNVCRAMLRQLYFLFSNKEEEHTGIHSEAIAMKKEFFGEEKNEDCFDGPKTQTTLVVSLFNDVPHFKTDMYVVIQLVSPFPGPYSTQVNVTLVFSNPNSIADAVDTIVAGQQNTGAQDCNQVSLQISSDASTPRENFPLELLKNAIAALLHSNSYTLVQPSPYSLTPTRKTRRWKSDPNVESHKRRAVIYGPLRLSKYQC